MFSVHTRTQIPLVWSPFSWWISLDGRPNCRNKAAFSDFSVLWWAYVFSQTKFDCTSQFVAFHVSRLAPFPPPITTQSSPVELALGCPSSQLVNTAAFPLLQTCSCSVEMSFRPVHARDQSGEKQGISIVIENSLVYGKTTEERRIRLVTLK